MTIKRWGEASTHDYNGVTIDSVIHQEDPNRNYGTQNSMNMRNQSTNHKRIVIRFDISSLSSLISNSSEIDSATLYFKKNTIVVDGAVDCYRLKREWNEGVNSDPASTGEVTWNSSKHNQVSWTTGGADNTTDDRDGTATDTAAIGTEELDVTQDIKDFFDGDETNYGWLLRTTQNNGNFNIYAHDTSLEANFPYLEIEYTEASSSSSSSSTSSSSSSLSSSSSSSSSSVSSSSSSSSLSSSSSSSSSSESVSSSSSSTSSSSSSTSSSSTSSSSTSAVQVPAVRRFIASNKTYRFTASNRIYRFTTKRRLT